MRPIAPRAFPRSAPRNRSNARARSSSACACWSWISRRSCRVRCAIRLGQTRIPALHGFSGNGTSADSDRTCCRRSTAPLGANSTMHFNSDPGFQSSFSDSSTNTIALAELTRAGWSNTAGQQRGTLQRVSYALVDDVLKRSYTTSLDTVQGTKPQIQDLFGEREDGAVSLPRRQSSLAEPMAAGEPLHPSTEICGRGRWRSRSPSSSRTGAPFAA